MLPTKRLPGEPPFTFEDMGPLLGGHSGARAAAAPVQGTFDIEAMYGPVPDKTLRDLGYTYAQAEGEFPYFCLWAAKEGWSEAEVIDQYKLTVIINHLLWVNDTYMGWGPYMDRPNRISQSRSHIILPHGTYRASGTAVVALGITTGQGSNVFGQAVATPSAPAGTTPGTMFVIDHVRWNKTRYPNRILMRTSSYGVDFGMVGGIAYSEGTRVENIRFSGGWEDKAPDTSFYSAGFASGDLGEASLVQSCFASGFNGDGFASMNGTPALFIACSSFNNTKLGFATLCTNGLNTTTYIGCSADDNKEGKYGNRPWTTGSVCGGTYTIVGDKCETRTAGMIFGNFQGQSTITVTGTQLDVSSNPIDHWFKMDPKGKQWQLDVRGLQHGFNVNSLVFNVATGQRLSTPGPYQGMSFVVNDTGVFNTTRNGIAWSGTGGGTNPPPPPPPPTGTIAVTASVASATEQGVLREPKYMVDGNANSFWMGMGGMTNGQKVTITFPAVRKMKGLTFKMPVGYTNSYPKKYEVRTSAGSTFASAGTFTGAAATTAAWAERDVLSLEIICREANPSAYWGISEVTFQ